ncbi:hypothetical protein [Streptomyces hayashii]|uniref:hypothetical protein n=1 Tax=Streptomyces hayashii TaxID=2839966 RepID=UPI00403D1B36
MSKAIKQGPFLVDGVIPFLKPLADYGWAVGLASAVLFYTLPQPRHRAEPGCLPPTG